MPPTTTPGAALTRRRDATPVCMLADLGLEGAGGDSALTAQWDTASVTPLSAVGAIRVATLCEASRRGANDCRETREGARG